MMLTEEQNKDLDFLLENGAITSSERNLRSKIDSIIRALENLSEKKMRIEFEIKRQTQSLTRKREELKRVSKRDQVKTRVFLENSFGSNQPIDQEVLELQKIDSILLQESYRVLEQQHSK